MQAVIRILLIWTLAVAGQSASAQADRLQPDFTFKRIGVPSGSAGRRITVQVAPAPVSAPAAASAAVPETADLPMAWFWQAVSPARDAGATRTQAALQNLARSPEGAGVPAPRLQLLQDIARAHGREILRNTVGTDVSPALVVALIAVESAGRAEAESGAGAQGLMQLMPATAARFGVEDAFAPAENIRGGTQYLAWLLDHFERDPILALAGYNAGEGSVRDHDGVPPFAETRAYIPKVLAAWTVAKGLCLTPPELLTDGCVFASGG